MTLNVSAYPLCKAKLAYQYANLNDPLMTHYWAAVCVADEISDAALAKHGGFNFDDRSPENGRKLLSELEKFLVKRQQNKASSSVLASEQLKAMLGARGIKTSMMESENDYWTAAETLFPGQIKRNGGTFKLYQQILRIPKKERKRLADANLHKIKPEWLSSASSHQHKLTVN